MKYKTVALASFPRSGNTWMRHLIHEATGFGSKYMLNPETGPVHEAAAIPQIADESSPLIKTHALDASQYEAAVHIVRHPLSAISSYLDYCQKFNIQVSRKAEFITVEATGWVRHTEHWRMALQCGILKGYYPVRYEDLSADTGGKLAEILGNFIGIRFNPEDIRRAVKETVLPKLQKKGSPDFFPKGMNRNPNLNLRPEWVQKINSICWEEMEHWSYG